jgi:hypothetical protein
MLQAPLGQSPAAAHGCPAFEPSWQRLPPQIPPDGQSAFELHGVALMLSHVSHRHFRPVDPLSRQFGLVDVSLRVTVPVEFDRSIGSFPMTLEPGGQSRLVAPKDEFGDDPLTSHAWPLLAPASHVPPRFPSLGVASPVQRGHGCSFFVPRKTCEINFTELCDAPDSMLAVPLIGPLSWFKTHVETPPAESGSNVPKKNSHVPDPEQSALLVQVFVVSPVQRWLLRSVPVWLV